MARFQELLRYLENEQVAEIILASGAPVSLRAGQDVRPLTRTPITTEQVQLFVAGSPVAALVPQRDAPEAVHAFSQDGRSYEALVARARDRLQIRLRAAPRAAATESSGLELDTADVSAARRAPMPAPRAPEPMPSPRVPEPMNAPDALQRPAVSDAAGGAQRHLSVLLVRARQASASDVHVVSEQRASIRKVGKLLPVGQVIPDDAVRAMILPLLPERAAAELDRVGYTDLAVDLPDAGRTRLNVCRQRTGIKACFRLVAPEPLPLGELGLPEALTQVKRYHQGLVVISGPTGHGKTTTMASLLDVFNRERPVHILTVEDPVEVIHQPKRAVVTQREVGFHTQSFQSALKASLREDPDIIAIGELRDRETVEMALTAAETGHLVLATMSTPSGARTIDRLIDMFSPEDQQQVRATLAGALKLVVSQRLVPSLDGSRLVPAAELITGSVPLWTLIRDNKLYQLPSLLQRGKAYGMIRVEDSLKDLVARKVITVETAMEYADDPRAFGGEEKPAAPDPHTTAAAAGGQPAQKRGGIGRLFNRDGD